MVSLGLGSSGLLFERGVTEDSSLDLGVEGFYTGRLGGLETFIPLRELLHVFFITVFLQGFHVLVNMNTEDSVSVDLGIIGLVLTILDIARELVGGMGNKESTITSTFHHTEHFVTSGGVDQTHI